MNYPQYSYYQETGLNSIKMIPTHWKMIRNGNLFQQRNQSGNLSDPILEVSIHTGVKVRDLSNHARKQIMSDASKYKKAVIQDLAYNMMRMWQGAVGVVPANGLVSPAYIVLSPFPHADPTYYAYLFKTKEYMSEVHKYSRGIVPDRNRLYWESFKQIPSCYPPIEEQKMIVGYLKAKTIQINKIIQKKKSLIELLKEQKQASINQAVIRGLDPKVSLKPSGVELIGDIPEHWKISRLRNLATVRASGVDKHTVEGETSVRLCNYVDVYKNNEITDQLDFMKASATPAEIANFQLLQGDVIITKDSEDWRDIGVPAYVPQNIDNLICGYHLSLIRTNSDLINGRFLYTSLLSEAVVDQFRISATGVTRFGLSQGSIKDVQIPLPPIAEQKAISEYIEFKNESINQLIARIQKEIHLIQEYRTRLISDVVTGKIDVRNIEIVDIVEEELIENILEEEQEEESLELIGASDDD